MPANSTPTRKSGKVKFFNNEKGFGFILVDGQDEEVFFHRTAVHGQISLAEGQSVTFASVASQKGNGMKAVDVRPEG